MDLYIADRDADSGPHLFKTENKHKLFHNIACIGAYCLGGVNASHFDEISASAGVEGFQKISTVVVANKGTLRSAIGVAWGDVDGDGFQDLFVLNVQNGMNVLVHNVNGTSFTDVYSVLVENADGTFEVAENGFGVGNSNSAVFGDFDRDGDLDIFVSNHDSANELYRNDGNGRFTEIGAFAGVADARTGFGAACADYDHDGYLDLYVGNHNGSSNVLYHNNGNGTFRDVTSDAGVGDTGSTYSVAWGDYDGDGLVDLIVTNHEGCNPHCHHWGREETWDDPDSSASQRQLFVTQTLPKGTHNRSSANKLFRNLGDGTFTDVAAAVGVEDAHADSFAAAWVDFDLDGDLDLYVSNMHMPNTNRLYRNDAPTTTTLVVRPLGPKGLAIIPNAIVEMYLQGVLVGLRMTDGGSGYRSQSLSPAHFAGLRAHTTYTVVTSIPGFHTMQSSHTTGEDGAVAWLNVRLEVRSSEWHTDSPSRAPTTGSPSYSPTTGSPSYSATTRSPSYSPTSHSPSRSRAPVSALTIVLVVLGAVVGIIGLAVMCHKRLRRCAQQPRHALQSLLLDEQHYELVEANESEREPKAFNESYDDLPAYVRSLQNSPAPSFVASALPSIAEPASCFTSFT